MQPTILSSFGCECACVCVCIRNEMVMLSEIPDITINNPEKRAKH